MNTSYSFLFLLSVVILSACATAQHESYVPIPQSVNEPIKRLTVDVKGQSGFPSSAVENLVIEHLSNKGYEILTREDLLKKVQKEQDIKGKIIDDYSMNLQVADAMLFLEVTQWKQTHYNGSTYVEELTIVAKLINPESGKIIWVKNASPTHKGLIQQLVSIPINIFVGHRNPITEVLEQILNSFPPCQSYKGPPESAIHIVD